MQCLEFRRAVGADPSLSSAEILEHERQCAACAAHRRELIALDAKLRRALEIRIPGQRPFVPSAPPVRRASWLALAASVLLAVGIGVGLWTFFPRATLAQVVVDHIHHEPGAMVTTADRVAPFALADVLAKGGIRLRPDFAGVSYARSCPVRGYVVPHLVVQTSEGPVTVLVMVHEHVQHEVAIDDARLRGEIVPAGPGSIAIIGTGPESVAEVRSRVLAAVEFIDSQ
jgi:Protein of unknown function (DUF3379)